MTSMTGKRTWLFFLLFFINEQLIFTWSYSMYSDNSPIAVDGDKRGFGGRKRPTKLLENLIDFYTRAEALEKKAELILWKDPYEEVIVSEMNPLRLGMVDLISSIKSVGIVEEKSNDEMKDFLNQITIMRKSLNLFADNSVEKHEEALVKLNQERVEFIKEANSFLAESKEVFERNVGELETHGIVVFGAENPEGSPLDLPAQLKDFSSNHIVFNKNNSTTLSVLNDLKQYYSKIENFEVQLLPFMESGIKEYPEEVFTTIVTPTLREIAIAEFAARKVIEEEEELLKNFVPSMEASLRRIQHRIPDIQKMYDYLTERWIGLAYEIIKLEAELNSEIRRLEDLAAKVAQDSILSLNKVEL